MSIAEKSEVEKGVVENTADKFVGVSGGVFAHQVGLDRVGMPVIVQVGAVEVHHIVVDKPFSHLFFSFAVVSAQTQHVYLKQCSGVV